MRLREIEKIIRFCKAEARARPAVSQIDQYIRGTATIGGNLCLDTRCDYDQSEPWRKAIDTAKEKDICWLPRRARAVWRFRRQMRLRR